MAEITLSVTIPDAHIVVSKAALEYHAIKYGALPEGGVFTNNQAIAYGRKQMEKCLLSIIKEFKQDTIVSQAEFTVQQELNAIVLT